jgi:hypothetical protein
MRIEEERIGAGSVARGFNVAVLILAAGCQQVRVASLAPQAVIAPSDREGAAQGFPALRTLEGGRLADGHFMQWLEDGRLHISIRYEFGPERSIEERAVVRQEPLLVQESWSWEETRDGRLHRRFEIDFLGRAITAEKFEGGELRRWSEHGDLEPGRAFAGSAFTLALKSLRSRLLRGEKVKLQTVGFRPEPKVAEVEVSYAGVDLVPMSGLVIEGERFVLHPLIPLIARPFVDVPDTRLWLVHAEPAAFLRWEGPLAEPDDAIVRVDLLPGEPSGMAMPVKP